MAGSGESSQSLLEGGEVPNQPERHGVIKFGLKKLPETVLGSVIFLAEHSHTPLGFSVLCKLSLGLNLVGHFSSFLRHCSAHVCITQANNTIPFCKSSHVITKIW